MRPTPRSNRGRVTAGWSREGPVELFVRDEGPALEPANLFVPFFTTKPGGSGMVCAEPPDRRAHGGSLTVRTAPTAAAGAARLPLER
jgi:C4-dicarboxylate-specific signal transduction histidine kinase